ncbi:MAG: type II toxin-antitoxin system HicB family antitoxin [Elusimicrobiota bacterium]
MNIRVVVEFDPKVKSYSVYCPELPGCVSCGDTEKEAMKNIREAIDLYLEPAPLKSSSKRKIKELAL